MEPAASHMAMVSQDGSTLYAWSGDDAMAKMRRSKRVRVSIGQAFYDFDLSKGEPMPAAFRC